MNRKVDATLLTRPKEFGFLRGYRASLNSPQKAANALLVPDPAQLYEECHGDGTRDTARYPRCYA